MKRWTGPLPRWRRALLRLEVWLAYGCLWPLVDWHGIYAATVRYYETECFSEGSGI